MANYLRPQISFFVFFLLISFASVSAQEVNLYGTVTDSLNQPIQGTNFLATPNNNTHYKTVFSISDSKGRYKLHLVAGVSYQLRVISLGYATLTDSIKLTVDTQQNIVMHPSTTTLETVMVRAQMAVIVKEDTIAYDVDQFRTGTERKLRDLLKNLPGVEVDREGNVTVNGKKVTSLMVDGKNFFGGNTQLGVNNIPADAVDKVVAIDDYHNVAFMKGLSHSDKLALNIKLKEGKKKFVFGEIETGGGIKERYYLHPTLFYYSPKTTVNFIGSIDNINASPLDWQDVLRFRGGVATFLDPIRGNNNTLSQFSSQTDIRSKKMLFGAANLTQQLSKKLQFSTYSIVAQQKTKSAETNHIEYLTQNNLVENRKATVNDKLFNNSNRIKLRLKPNTYTDMAYRMTANFSNGTHYSNFQSHFADSLSQTHTAQDPKDFKLAQFFRFNTRPTYKHTSAIKAYYIYSQESQLTGWDFDRPIFSDLIPLQPDGGNYHLYHDYSSVTNSGRFNFKHYWVLNNYSHLYPKAGIYFYNQTYHNTDYQRLQDGTINSFRSAGFNNALSYQLIDPYIGFQYKIKVGERLILEPGLVYHYYLWHINQFDKRVGTHQKGVFLPELFGKYEFSDGKELELNYSLNANFADANDYATRLRLTSFNTIYKGNLNLENALYHSLSLRFRSFSMRTGITYSFRLRYKHQEKSIQNSTRLEGIDQVNTSIYTDFPENSFHYIGNLSKSWSHFSLALRTGVSLFGYSRIINAQKLRYHNQSYNYRIRVRTHFKKGPNFNLSLSQNFRRTSSHNFKSNYYSIYPSLSIDYYFLKSFAFKAYYYYAYSKNKTSAISTHYQFANASLFYRKDGSPWGFELRVNNLFDINYKRNYSIDEFRIYDWRTYVQPRTLLFILSYHL